MRVHETEIKEADAPHICTWTMFRINFNVSASAAKRRTRRQITLDTKTLRITFLRSVHMKDFTRKIHRTQTIRSCINTSAWCRAEISIREIRQETWRFSLENSIITRNLHGIFMLMPPWRFDPDSIISPMLTQSARCRHEKDLRINYQNDHILHTTTFN